MEAYYGEHDDGKPYPNITQAVPYYTLLVIFNVPNKEQKHHIFTYNDNINFLELHTLSVSNGKEFVNKTDNIYLDKIIKTKYKFNLK